MQIFFFWICRYILIKKSLRDHLVNLLAWEIFLRGSKMWRVMYTLQLLWPAILLVPSKLVCTFWRQIWTLPVFWAGWLLYGGRVRGLILCIYLQCFASLKAKLADVIFCINWLLQSQPSRESEHSLYLWYSKHFGGPRSQSLNAHDFWLSIFFNHIYIRQIYQKKKHDDVNFVRDTFTPCMMWQRAECMCQFVWLAMEHGLTDSRRCKYDSAQFPMCSCEKTMLVASNAQVE